MALSSFLPSATSTLANSAPWFNAFFAEFQIYLYIGVGVLGAILMINFLIWVFQQTMFRFSKDYRINALRTGARDYIRENKQNESDFELWRKTQN